MKKIFSLDHKIIGLQYLFTAMVFLLSGFLMMVLMRWQLAYPGSPIPLIGGWLGDTFAPGGIMLPEFYNQLGAMHGTIMVFLGVVPLGVGFYGNYFLPLQIGARDMAFPKLNAASYWTYLLGGLLMFTSFALPGGAPQSGWTSYPPLSVIAPSGQTVWILSMVIIVTSSLFGSINFIVTVINLRAPGMSFLRLPIFVWTQFMSAILLLFAFPVLEGGLLLQLLDRVAGTSFYLPAGLVVSGQVLANTGGGSALLYQHLFWFLGHPEVYVLILPAMGVVAEILANNTRKPLFGYRTIVASLVFLALLSFLVWAHHMFLSGMKTSLARIFMTTTMLVSIPSVAILSCYLFSLWGGSIRFSVPMLFALAFLPLFGIGGLTGLPLGLLSTNIYLHDTYYVIGHFHYVVVTGTLIALMGGIYHWFPKMFGRRMNDFWGKFHFWGSVLAMNGIFFPMFIQGIAGVQRRIYDFGAMAHNATTTLDPAIGKMSLSELQWFCAVALLIVQVPFLINIFWSMFKGKKTAENPWEATTLEWTAPSPPPHGNFPKDVTVVRGPYEYSSGGDTSARDFQPQGETR